ncbi:Cg2 protein, putative [Plasmodium berghei]|uniref:Mediator of RNA polymerase II transcription subunit 14 n=2 Tax=Plasmodium berghei TaxID=5821 RepID=A0A509ANH2_PLABA|nr:Cg2 protein, putative [Plasmodium berghei ANKA]CXI77294.1 Cg2 protein, putative [Plasmodium berghei]SCM25027.1 Cg2 protein, putative [Plasmodium berghei]SCN27240.1 Cg2 protein, putative [Plasmodium berghei]SCO61826.1 Cg2 protein, putative [Plasmodium berghei]SCO63666.1 Cg2 protein, putative [Plasmodium berghei]|eukprot:XP_034422876.1 Cg2 protein, putative [Plasmodium berghei ANKA]
MKQQDEEDGEYGEYKGINYSLIIKKVLRRSINDWNVFCQKVENDNGNNFDYLISALIQYCRHIRECYLKILELEKYREMHKDIVEVIKHILYFKESYNELKTKYEYDIYLCKLKTLNLQLNQNNVLCALDLLSTKKYTRFPILFKQILKSPFDPVVLELNKYQIQILKKKIIDEFLINYYISKIPKEKVNFKFSQGLVELEIINQVIIKFITDFLTCTIIDVNILFLNDMNLHISHNYNLMVLINYAIMKRRLNKTNHIIGEGDTSNHSQIFENDNNFIKYPKKEVLKNNISMSDTTNTDYSEFSENDTYESSLSDSGNNMQLMYSPPHKQIGDIFYRYNKTKDIGSIESYYKNNKGKEKELELSDIYYEIYKTSNFYCNTQILEFFKAYLNQYNSYNYIKKQFQIYKKYKKTNKVESTPSCYNYHIDDSNCLLYLDIYLYDAEFRKELYNFFEKYKISILNENSEKKIILQFILNNKNGNVKIKLWPFDYFNKLNKKKKKEIQFDNILSYYEFIMCLFLKKKIKTMCSYNPLYIHLETWISKVSACLTYFLFSILKIFCTKTTKLTIEKYITIQNKCGAKLIKRDHTQTSEHSYLENTTTYNELITDYFFDINTIEKNIQCVEICKLGKKKSSMLSIEEVSKNASKEIDEEDHICLKNKLEIMEVKKNKNDEILYILRYTFYGQKIDLFMSNQSDKYIFKCYWDIIFLNVISLEYNLKIIIYIIYLLRCYSKYIYLYNLLKEKFKNNIKPGTSFPFELNIGNLYPNLLFSKLKLHEFLKKYDYSSNIVLTNFIEQFFEHINFFYYLSSKNGSKIKCMDTELEEGIKKAIYENFQKDNEKNENEDIFDKQSGEAKANCEDQGLKKDNEKKGKYRNNFFSTFYFKLYITGSDIPFLLCIFIENNFIFHTSIVVSFGNSYETEGKNLDKKNKINEENQKDHSKKGVNNYFIIPLIHKKCSIDDNVNCYFDGLKKMIVSFSNMLISLQKILQVNFYCPVLSPFNCEPEDITESIPNEGNKIENFEKEVLQNQENAEEILGYINDEIYKRNKKKWESRSIDLEYFINRISGENKKNEDVDVKDERIKNFMLQFYCQLNDEYDINKEYITNHRKDNKFIFIIKISIHGSFFFKIPIKRQKRYIKIDGFHKMENKNLVTLFYGSIVVNMKIKTLEIDDKEEFEKLYEEWNVENSKIENNNYDKKKNCVYGEEKEQKQLSEESNKQIEFLNNTIKDWGLLKEIHIILNGKNSVSKILDMFSVIIKSMFVINLLTELYYIEKMITPTFIIRNSHLANIDIMYLCSYDSNIVCSIFFDIFGGRGRDISNVNYSNLRYCKQNKINQDMNKNGNIENNLINEDLFEYSDILNKYEHYNNNENEKNENQNNSINKSYEKILKSLLFINICFNSYNEYINKIYLGEKENFNIYLKKKKNIFDLLKLISLTFEFHLNLHILINKTNNYLNKEYFLSQVITTNLFEIYYINLMTIILQFKKENDTSIDTKKTSNNIYDEKKNSNIDELSFYVILHPENFSKIVIIPHFSNNSPDKNENCNFIINNFFKKSEIFSELRKTKMTDMFTDTDDLSSSPNKNITSSNFVQTNNISNDSENNLLPVYPDQASNQLSNKIDKEKDNSFIAYKNNNNNIIIDNLNVEDLFVFLFLKFCMIINFQNEQNYDEPYDYTFNQTENKTTNNFKDLKSNYKKYKSYNISNDEMSNGFFEKELEIFEEYDTFINNVKYMFKLKNNIIISKIDFFRPTFLYATLYTLLEFIVSLKKWLIMFDHLKLEYENFTLSQSTLPNVFQYMSAAKRQSSNQEISQGKSNDKNSNIYIHLVWFIYNIKTLHLEKLENKDEQNNKRYYGCFHGDNKEDIDLNHINNSKELESRKIKKLKIEQVENLGDVSNEKTVKKKEENIIENEIKLNKSSEVMININKRKEENKNILHMLNDRINISEINTEKLYYMINAYSYNNNNIFLKKNQKKIIKRNFIENVYLFQKLRLKKWDERKVILKNFDDKLKNENDDNSNNKSYKYNNNMKIDINMYADFSNNLKVINGCDIHYLLNSFVVYFENIGEEIEKQDSWFYRQNAISDNTNLCERFILNENNILKENSKLNSALNIIYKYIRIWLFKMRDNNIICFFNTINQIIYNQKNICEFSSLVFNSVLSYEEYLKFWTLKNTNYNFSMPFIETEFFSSDDKVDKMNSQMDKKQHFVKMRKFKFVEYIIPFKTPIQNYMTYREVVSNATDRVITDKSITDKTITDKSITDKTITDKSITDKSITDKTITDKSITDKSITDKSITDNKMKGYDKITVKYKIWKYMPCPFKEIYIDHEKQKFISLNKNESISLTFKIASIPVKNLKEVYINNDSYIKFLIYNNIDLNLAHQKVMQILQAYNLMPNYSLVASQTILHSETFDILLKNSNKKENVN